MRGALVELGTTWVKFGQMLSLRSDLVGEKVARELTKLQAEVPADPPGVAHACVKAELGGSTDKLYASFDVEPFASGSVAQVHRATLTDGTEVVVKVVHDGADRKVLEDLDLMHALARYVESNDPELAQFRPTILVDEFAQMMQSAVDLSQELDNLRRFNTNFADEPDVVIPNGYADRSSGRVLTMSLIQGITLDDRGTIEATGWDVDALVKRATEHYLEMIFRDGIYHADPHPGNFLLPDGAHMAILDFGDVGRLSPQRRLQLESLVIAVVAKDVDELTDVILELTSPPADVDLPRLRSDIDAWMNRYLLAGVAQLDLAGIISSGMALMHTHRLVLPADLALLFPVLLRLHGLGRGIGTDVHVDELLRPYVAQMPRSVSTRDVWPDERGGRLEAGNTSWPTSPRNCTPSLEQVRTGDLGVGLPHPRCRWRRRPDCRRAVGLSVGPGLGAAPVATSRTHHRRYLTSRSRRRGGRGRDVAAARGEAGRPALDDRQRPSTRHGTQTLTTTLIRPAEALPDSSTPAGPALGVWGCPFDPDHDESGLYAAPVELDRPDPAARFRHGEEER